MNRMLGIAITAVGLGLYAGPAAADATADAVWAELAGMDAALTARADFAAHIDFTDADGFTYYEVRALVHHLDDAQIGAMSHACHHILAARSQHSEAAAEFCGHLEDALSDTPDEEQDN